ncbi:MAG: sigma-70 family RNA polymerase sigma factor [Symbiobacteriaceae bacterium]
MTREAPEALFQRNERLAYWCAQPWLRSFPSWMHEEVLAEARVGLWRACRSYDPARGIAFSTYATIVIQNELRRFYRDMRRHHVPTVSLETEIIEPEAAHPRKRRLRLGDVIALEERLFSEAEARLLMDSLPPIMRMVAAGMTQKEIARRLGRTQGAVSQRLQRERAQVRQWFEGRMAG